MPAGRRDRVRPVGAVGLEEAVPRGAREGRVRPAVPDVRLRIRLLRAQPVIDLLGAHVEPADVDLRVRPLEFLLDEAEEVPAVRRIDRQGRAAVGAAAGCGGRDSPDQASEKKNAGAETLHGTGVGWPRRFIISSYCLRCSGDMRLRASLKAFSCSGVRPPTAKPVSL